MQAFFICGCSLDLREVHRMKIVRRLTPARPGNVGTHRQVRAAFETEEFLEAITLCTNCFMTLRRAHFCCCDVPAPLQVERGCRVFNPENITWGEVVKTERDVGK